MVEGPVLILQVVAEVEVEEVEGEVVQLVEEEEAKETPSPVIGVGGHTMQMLAPTINGGD